MLRHEMDFGEKGPKSRIEARRHPWWERDPTLRPLIARALLIIAFCGGLAVLSLIGSALSGR
jgi:hypothetical protein